jgi:phosphohistidine phosphatase
VKLERGTHKYVQVQLTHPDEPGTAILVVRSVDVRRCPYHADVYRALMDELGSDARTRGVIGRVIGGGRIRRDAATVSVYGYSKTFGRTRGCNERTAELIRANVDGLASVEWSDDGY